MAQEARYTPGKSAHVPGVISAINQRFCQDAWLTIEECIVLYGFDDPYPSGHSDSAVATDYIWWCSSSVEVSFEVVAKQSASDEFYISEAAT
jgi:hypothetical protein